MSRDYRWLEILSHAISTVSLFIRLMASWSYLTALRYECERWRESERCEEMECAWNKSRKGNWSTRKIRENDRGLLASIRHCREFQHPSLRGKLEYLTGNGIRYLTLQQAGTWHVTTTPNTYCHNSDSE